MKKTLTFLMATAMMTSMSLTAYATSGTTTLTTVVPAATYTLNVPAQVTIPYGSTQTDFGVVSIADAEGFSPYKGVKVTLEAFDDLACEGIDTTISYSVMDGYDVNMLYSSGKGTDSDLFVFPGNADGGLNHPYGFDGADAPAAEDGVSLIIFTTDTTDWQKAVAGTYTSTLTFSSEVVTLQ